MEFKNILLEKEGNVAILTINRRKALNALNSETLKEIDTAIDDLVSDDGIYVLLITGSGEKSFVAGADISEMKDMSPVEARRFSILGNKVFRRLETIDIPVIAAVNGYALGGGCELAMCCDIRYASTKAKFGQPEAGLGVTPGFGGTQRLSRLVGSGAAKELIFSSKTIDAAEALRIGLVNKVTEPETLLSEAKALALQIAAQAPIAVRLSKAAISRGAQCDIDTALMYEAEVFGECFSTEDQKEGMSAFVEKREKRFYNK
jgi:enoyl-CoA hydratase